MPIEKEEMALIILINILKYPKGGGQFQLLLPIGKKMPWNGKLPGFRKVEGGIYILKTLVELLECEAISFKDWLKDNENKLEKQYSETYEDIIEIIQELWKLQYFVEERLYEFVNNWFHRYFKEFINDPEKGINIKTIKSSVNGESLESVKTSLEGWDEKGIKPIDRKSVVSYNITSFESFIGTIFDLSIMKCELLNGKFSPLPVILTFGEEDLKKEEILKKFNSIFYISPFDFYTCPLRLNSKDITETFAVHYNNILKGFTAGEALDFIIDGKLLANSLEPSTGLVASYICESTRNNVQLLLSLLQLGLLEKSTCEVSIGESAEDGFPMGASGWTNHWCWGSRLEKMDEKIGNTKRSMLRILISIMLDSDIVKKRLIVNALTKLWVDLISIILEKKEGSLKDFMIFCEDLDMGLDVFCSKAIENIIKGGLNL